MISATKYAKKLADLDKLVHIKRLTVECTMQSRGLQSPTDRLYDLLEKREADTNRRYAENERLSAKIRANQQSILDNTVEMKKAYAVIAAITKREPQSR